MAASALPGTGLFIALFVLWGGFVHLVMKGSQLCDKRTKLSSEEMVLRAAEGKERESWLKS